MSSRVGPRQEVSEDAIALAFTKKYSGWLLFDHDQGCWYEWDGTRWRQDKCEHAFHYARELARSHGDGKRAMGRAAVAAGVEKLAKSDPKHAVNSSIWDDNPMLLGTPGGTVDLTNGELSAANPEARITRQTSVVPEEGEPYLWLAFLDETFAGDAELVQYVRTWFGYCLTGETREHALAFAYGPGGNGKSVFLNTLAAIMGDYAVTAALDTFTASRCERHSTELAMFRGARLVTASEIEEGKAWAEAKVKTLTGGDSVTARFMRQDYFTYKPQFKLTIAGNHPPALRSVDDAMRRRINIIPFTHKPVAPDRMLEDKLRAEHGRILAWAIVGCLDWQRVGLIQPQAVAVATGSYFDEQDVFGQWIADDCIVGPEQWDLPTLLFERWRKYALAVGVDPMSAQTFARELKRRGFASGKSNGSRTYKGICVRRSPFCET